MPMRRRLPDHAVVQHGAEIAQRAENLGARHQHDEQRLQRHHAVGHTVDAERKRRRGADADADIDDAARDQIGRQHPHRRGGEFARLAGQHAAVSRALAERLERRQTLDGVEKFGAETFQRGAVRDADFAIEPAEDRRQHQTNQREAQHQRRDRHVPPGDDGEHGERRERRDGELRHVLAEKALQLLDAVDHRQHDAAGALAGEPGRPEFGDLVVELEPQHLLHARRGAVRHHGALVFEKGAHEHHRRDRRRRQYERRAPARRDRPAQ